MDTRMPQFELMISILVFNAITVITKHLSASV